MITVNDNKQCAEGILRLQPRRRYVPYLSYAVQYSMGKKI